MWRTSQGDRVLTGDEARVVKAALLDLVDELATAQDEHETGVQVFDALSLGQRLATLEDLSSALFNPSIPAPPHSAANEAAIYAVYHQLKSMVELEVDSDPVCTDIRRLVRAACYECGLRALAETEDECTEWSDSIEELSDQVLWDRDFSDGDMFLDAVPTDTRPDAVDISEDYFAAISREIRDAEISETFSRLRRALQG
jgi:hypothetical protein